MQKDLAIILNAREERAQYQQELINRFHAVLLSFALNIPGIKKYPGRYRVVHDIAYNAILEQLQNHNEDIVYQERQFLRTGDVGYILVKGQAEKIKNLMIDIEENHPLGRIFDIDVFDHDHEQISRAGIGGQKRSCMICGKNVTVCRRLKRHTVPKYWMQ